MVNWLFRKNLQLLVFQSGSHDAGAEGLWSKVNHTYEWNSFSSLFLLIRNGNVGATKILIIIFVCLLQTDKLQYDYYVRIVRTHDNKLKKSQFNNCMAACYVPICSAAVHFTFPPREWKAGSTLRVLLLQITTIFALDYCMLLLNYKILF